MAQRELTPADYLAMLRRHWVMIVICTLVGGPLAYGVSRVLPVKYKSQTLVLVEQQSVPTDYVKSIDTADISQRLSSMQQQILSRSRLEPIIREYGLYARRARGPAAEGYRCNSGFADGGDSCQGIAGIHCGRHDGYRPHRAGGVYGRNLDVH